MHMPPVSSAAAETLDYTEEIFCLNFELRTMAQLVFHHEAERWLHGFMFGITEQEHLSRYNYIVKHVAGKRVLDVACGSGYGSYLLAAEGNADHVDALDLNAESIRYAEHRHSHPAVRRWVGDAEQYYKEGAYDVIISFETVEHLPNYVSFLENVARSLAPSGTFCVSTPITRATTTQCNNPYHVIEWSFADFQKLISSHFIVEEVYVQNIHLLKDIPSASLLHRVRRKLSPPIQPKRSVFERYTGQYEPNDIYHGYQVLVCKKKA